MAAEKLSIGNMHVALSVFLLLEVSASKIGTVHLKPVVVWIEQSTREIGVFFFLMKNALPCISVLHYWTMRFLR